MVKRSQIDLKAGEIGDNVAVPIPMVDRGRGDPRNILGVILDPNENDLYRIAVIKKMGSLEPNIPELNLHYVRSTYLLLMMLTLLI